MNKLVFINGLGTNYNGQNRYEFIFSNSSEIWDETWDHEPSNGYPKSPDLKFIDSVGVLSEGGIDLELVQDSDFFSMRDAIDGVICLGWEKDKDIDDRLVFRYGDSESDTKDKLYSKDLILNFEKIV
jgi:hypothetical protein